MTKKIKMSEQAYIVIGDLHTVGIARTTLSDIVPSFTSLIDEAEYRMVMRLLAEWEESMRKSIQISTTKEKDI